MTKFDKPLPNDLKAEQAVLGSLLMDNELINEIGVELQPDDFYNSANSIIYQAMLDTYDREQKFDIILITSEIMKKKKLKFIGGAHYLSSLLEVVSTALNCKHHSKIVRDRAVLRKLILLGVKLTDGCLGESIETRNIISDTETELLKLSEIGGKKGIVKASEIVIVVLEKLDKLSRNPSKITGVPSGFKSYDKITHGFEPGTLILIAGRPSTGKSTFISNVNEHLIGQDIPQGLISLEMSRESWIERMISSMSRVDHEKIRSGYLNKEEWTRILKATSRINSASFWIDDTAALNDAEIRMVARTMKMQHDVQIIFIDYLQLIRCSDRSIKDKTNQTGHISGSMKALAKELSIPIVICSQLSRDVEKRKDPEPMLSDLRDSGSLEQDADVVGFVWKKKVSMSTPIDDDGITKFAVGKHRNGRLGQFDLLFHKEFCKFGDMSRVNDNNELDTSYQDGYDDEVPF